MTTSTEMVQNDEDFDDQMHRLINFCRPKDATETSSLSELVSCLIQSCTDDHARWKRFLLSLVHKRYHLLSPEARDCKEKGTISVGDGERKIFYTGVQELFRRAFAGRAFAGTPESDASYSDYSVKAYTVLLQIAPFAGGSRDICTIIEESLAVVIKDSVDSKKNQMEQLFGCHSLSLLVGCGVASVLDSKVQHTAAYSALADLIQLAADTLDQDLDIIRRANETKETPSRFPSTLHVFIPHHERGRPNKKSKLIQDRQIINSVAEILIWSHTSAAMSNTAFKLSYERFLEAVTKGDKEGTKAALHCMQTIIRKSLRKELNTYARDQGFMLADQYQLQADDSNFNSSKIVRGKAGDIDILTKQAFKKNSKHLLELVAFRLTSRPSDATACWSSVSQLCQSWAPDYNKEDEIHVLQRDIQISKFKATISYHQQLVQKSKRRAVVCSMESSQQNDVTALLIAAAMSPWSVDQSEGEIMEIDNAPQAKLFIGGVERAIKTFDDCMELMDLVVRGLEKNEIDAPSFMDQDGVATTKAVINMIERNVGDGEALLLITSADISLPEDTMKGLIDRDCSIHCHDTDDIGKRLEREKAQKGDVTISLAWDTEDDLDLHVILPNREELYFGHDVSDDGNCCLDVDMNAGGGGSTEPVENVFLGNLETMMEATRGLYKVFVQNFAYHAGDSTAAIPFRVVVEKNGTKEKFTGECKGERDTSDVVVCEFDYQGREVPFPGAPMKIQEGPQSLLRMDGTTEEPAPKSAFATSNLINITASSGQTLEALGNLVQVLQQQDHLNEMRQLVADMDGEDTDYVDEATARLLVAEHGTLEMTSRDRLDILLAKLPRRFHLIVAEAFGGAGLVEECAKEVARRMVADKIPFGLLKLAGYPDDIVKAVKQHLASSVIVGVSSSE